MTIQPNFRPLLRTMIWTVLGPTLLMISATPTHAQVDSALFQSMHYRNIGPFRGGRVTTVTGVPGQIFTYYMGATGGGVWKTTDAGTTWQNISDGYFNTTGIGAIAVAPSDPNTIYIGTGESPVRGVKTSHGDGVYKSTDAGASWTHLGLEATRHISRIIVDPRDPDRVYLAAQGNPWGPNEERGIYLSEDGGQTWEKILYVNEDAGIVDLTVDATNPSIMMATSWDFRRQPWVVKSGGPGSRVYKTTDAGANWREITDGLPSLKGKMGIAISPANPKSSTWPSKRRTVRAAYIAPTTRAKVSARSATTRGPGPGRGTTCTSSLTPATKTRSGY